MKRALTIALLLSSLAGAQLALAAEVSSKIRTYSYSCGYFSSHWGEVEVSFKEETLPWGSSVQLIHGWQGSSFENPVIDWNHIHADTMEATGPYTWKQQVKHGLWVRSSSEHYNGLQFVFLITLPDGHQYYDKGGRSRLGYYFTPVSGSTSADCIESGDPLPAFRPGTVRAIDRN